MRGGITLSGDTLTNFDPFSSEQGTWPCSLLFELTGRPNKAFFGTIPNGPKGKRSIFNVLEGEFSGPRLKGTIVQPSGDWATDASIGRMLDVRLTLRTDNGATILMLYKGIIQPDRIRISPDFEAEIGSPYEFLNSVHAFGIGRRNEDHSITYRVFSLD